MWHDTKVQVASILESHTGEYVHSVASMHALHLECCAERRAHCTKPTCVEAVKCDALYEPEQGA